MEMNSKLACLSISETRYKQAVLGPFKKNCISVNFGFYSDATASGGGFAAIFPAVFGSIVLVAKREILQLV